MIKLLIEKGLLEQVEANHRQGDPVWSDTGDGHGVTLVITAAGLAALGLEPGAEEHAAAEFPTTSEAARIPGDDVTAPALSIVTRQPRTRDGTKQPAIVAMLHRPEGATLEELVAATGWQSQMIHGAMAGALKKKLGLTTGSRKVDARGRVYKAQG